MDKINNKYGIEMYYELDGIENKVWILDSNKKYFNDLYYDVYGNDEGKEDIDSIINTLENTTLEEMCNFMGHSIFESIEDIITYYDDENIKTLQDVLKTDYLNIFYVNGKTKYCLFEG